jgi:hypothetical protein
MLEKYSQSKLELDGLEREIEKWKKRCFELQEEMKGERPKHATAF